MAELQLHSPLVISFSGLDGSGKTTQIEALRHAAEELSLTTTLITFWDDVVVGTRFRSSFVHKVYGSEEGIGAPGRPVERRDKNVRAWYLTVMRHLLYTVDAVSLRFVLSRALRSGAQVIIVDRYLYDELANLPLEKRISANYAKLLARIAPRPQLAFLLDADPELARARKPEYSVEFLCKSRRSYFRLSQLLGNITVIPSLTLEEARREVIGCFRRLIGQSEPALTGERVA
jgi:thymidylate kinase